MSQTLQPINPEQPNVFNGIEVSYGIAPILGAISDISRKRDRKPWNLYLINIETLIRDRKDNSATPEQIARNVITDCTVLSQYIATYNNMLRNPNTKINPVICFYIAHYENIPKKYLRDKFPKGTEERWAIRDRVSKIITDEGFIQSFEGTDILFTIEDGKKAWCHKSLIQSLASKYDSIPYRTTLLISHVCSDFHLCRVFKDFTLLESYTGAFKSSKEFGKKVFGDENVPFNKYTHLLLGDKWYVKLQLDNKSRNILKQTSANNNWSVLPDKTVLEQIINLHLPNIQPELIIRPDI